MTQLISSFNRRSPVLQDEATSPALQNTTEKFNLFDIESYRGTAWINTPGMSNIVYAPYEAALATGALIRGVVTQDEEAQLDATLRLAQQPFSFFGAIGSISMTVLRVGFYFKSFQFQSLMPLANIAASGLGLALCVIEIFFESLGLYRVTSFISNFYCTGAPKIPDFSDAQDAEKLKEKLIRWACYIIDNSELMENNLGAPTNQAITQQLSLFIDDLERNSDDLSQADIRAQAQNFLLQVNEKLTLTDLKNLHRQYFSISSIEREKIDRIARHRFPDFSRTELDKKKDEIATALVNRKASNLARRIQDWSVHELNEKLDPLIQKLSHADPEVRAQAYEEANKLLKSVDIQAKKKMVAHIIGIISIIFVASGLIAGLGACPYILPIVLLSIGGGVALARYYFSLSCWKTRGWHFEISECIPRPIKWIYRKIMALRKVQEAARTAPWHDFPFRKRQVFQLSDTSSFLPVAKAPTSKLSDTSCFLPVAKAPSSKLSDTSCFLSVAKAPTFKLSDVSYFFLKQTAAY